jgi:rhodanese-related sulfurtransferase
LNVRALFVAGALALLAACGDGAGAPAISGEELESRIEQGDAPLVVDVRTPEEYAAGHVPGALNIPSTQLAGRVGELGLESRDREIVLYCERGGRAEEAAATLARAGFGTVRHLEGDMSAWREAGRPCDGCARTAAR